MTFEAFLQAHPGRDFLVNGVRLHYIDEGEGEPLIMLHGNPTWSYMFRHLIDDLRGRYRVIAIDHVGCGMSERPADSKYEYTLSRRVADLEALFDHLGLTDNLTLIMHDWGGMIGMSYAARHRDRIARLVLMNTAAFFLPESKPFPWELKLARTPIIGALGVRALNVFCKGSAKHCVLKPLPTDVRGAYLKPYDSWSNRIAVHRFVQDVPIKPGDRAYEMVRATRDALGEFERTPMLICWGEADFIFDNHFLNEWVRRTPFAEILRLRDAGHYLMEDEPEAVAARVRSFLSENPPPPKSP